MSDGNSVWDDLETAGPYRAGFHACLTHAAIAVAADCDLMELTVEQGARGLTRNRFSRSCDLCASGSGLDPQDPPPEDPPPEFPPMDRETLYDFFEGMGEAIELGDKPPWSRRTSKTFERFFELRFEVNDLDGA